MLFMILIFGMIICDDEHGWADNGIFNFEGGCYAKVINLDKNAEPDIYNAIRHGALLENVVFNEETKTFVEPYLPNYKIGIMHLAAGIWQNNKDMRLDKNITIDIKTLQNSIKSKSLRFIN